MNFLTNFKNTTIFEINNFLDLTSFIDIGLILCFLGICGILLNIKKAKDKGKKIFQPKRIN